MQCLSSPTRSEVDAAYGKKKSLDIGLVSFTNLFHIQRQKILMWLLLCLSSMPLHLLWNSTIFSTSGTSLFSYVVAQPSFLKTSDIPIAPCLANDSTTVEALRSGYQSGIYTLLTPLECANHYLTSGYLVDRRNPIVMVTPYDNTQNMTLCGDTGLSWYKYSVLALGVDLVPGLWTTEVGGFNMTGNGTVILNPALEVSHCWSETAAQASPCQLQYAPMILYVVIACNLVKLCCMAYTAYYLWDLNEPILATVGDAVASFLDHPDDTTKGRCLHDFDTPEGRRDPFVDENEYDPVYRRRLQVRLFHATTWERWWITILTCAVYYLSAGIVLWTSSLVSSKYSISETLRMNFGQVDEGLIMGIGGSSGSALIRNIVIANTFQLALSMTYFLYNSLATAQYSAIEWTSYIQGTLKPLRVTFPHGHQRSTYYLQLPYRYSIPLISLLALMHFLISQSIFLARLQYFDSFGDLTDQGFTDVGYSPKATITTIGVGLWLIIAQIVHAQRKIDNRIPMHGNQSASISAMCHLDDGTGVEADAKNGIEVETDTDTDADISYAGLNELEKHNISTKPLMRGVIRMPLKGERNSGLSRSRTADGGSVQKVAEHCSFTDRVVELPVVGKEYR